MSRNEQVLIGSADPLDTVADRIGEALGVRPERDATSVEYQLSATAVAWLDIAPFEVYDDDDPAVPLI